WWAWPVGLPPDESWGIYVTGSALGIASFSVPPATPMTLSPSSWGVTGFTGASTYLLWAEGGPKTTSHATSITGGASVVLSPSGSTIKTWPVGGSKVVFSDNVQLVNGVATTSDIRFIDLATNNPSKLLVGSADIMHIVPGYETSSGSLVAYTYN